MNVYRSEAGGMSDHYLLEEKVGRKGFWKREKQEVTTKRDVRVSELEKEKVREAFVILIVNEWDVIRNTKALNVEEEWEMFKNIAMTCAARVCVYKSRGRKKRGGASWDEEIKEIVREKIMLFEIYVTDKNERNREEYRQNNPEVKRNRIKKNEVDESYCIQLSTKFWENKNKQAIKIKLFWSATNMKSKERDQMSMLVTNSDGDIVTDVRYIKQKWNEYFKWLLNVGNGRRAEMSESGPGVMYELVNGELEISVEDVGEAVKKLKGVKLPGMDGITSEMPKCGGDCLLEWLRRFLMHVF